MQAELNAQLGEKYHISIEHVKRNLYLIYVFSHIKAKGTKNLKSLENERTMFSKSGSVMQLSVDTSACQQVNQ